MNNKRKRSERPNKRRKSSQKRRTQKLSLLVQEKQGEIEELQIFFGSSNQKVVEINQDECFDVNTTNVKALYQSLLSCNILSEDVVGVSENIIGERTFGIIKEGFFQTLGLKCAIKIGKHVHFNAELECRILQKLKGSTVFSIFLWSV